MNVAATEGLEVVPVEGDLGERFAAGSISKPVAELTVLRLGLDLDAEVNERLESWRLPEGDGVTLRRLLGHTGGINMPFCPGCPAGEDMPQLVQVLDDVRVETPPGSGFRYSGGGYCDSFSALRGSLDGRRGVVAQQTGGATPELFRRIASVEGVSAR